MTCSAELYLAGFAPLLQVWGGICLLFFYTELIKRSPLDNWWKESLKSICDCSSLLLTKYQNLSSSQEKLTELESYLNDTDNGQKFNASSWEKTRTALYNLAKFGFFHVTTLLIYCGFEAYNLCKNIYPVLLIIDIIAVLYIISNSVFIKHSFSQKNWGVYLGVALMIGILLVAIIMIMTRNSYLFCSWIKEHNISRTAVTAITLVVSIVAYFIAILADFIHSIYVIRKCDRAQRKINRLFNLWTDLSNRRSIPWWLMVAVFFDVDGSYSKTGRDLLEEYIRRKIDKLLWPAVDRIMQEFPPSES